MLCHIYCKGSCLFSQWVKWSSTRDFKNKVSLQKKITNWKSPSGFSVTSLLTEVASESQCCPTGILLHREAESTMGQWEKRKAILKWPWGCDEELTAPESLCCFFTRGIFMQFITHIQKPKISLILHSSSWATKGCVRSHASWFYITLYNCPQKAHEQHVRTHDVFPNQPSPLHLTWTASLEENCKKKTLVENLRPKWLTGVQGTINLDQVYP